MEPDLKVEVTNAEELKKSAGLPKELTPVQKKINGWNTSELWFFFISMLVIELSDVKIDSTKGIIMMLWPIVFAICRTYLKVRLLK